MFYYDIPIPKKKAGLQQGPYLVPSDWKDQAKRPRGVESKNGMYYMVDATPAKNAVYLSSEEVIRLKELSFFLVWRYQKTYTREAFEMVHAKMFQAFQDYLDGKRPSLEGIQGLFNGIPFGDKQYKYKQSFFVNQSVPPQFQGAKLVMAITVDRVQGPAGNVIKNPQDMTNAYKEIKTILTQEIDYMAQNPAFQKQPDQPA